MSMKYLSVIQELQYLLSVKQIQAREFIFAGGDAVTAQANLARAEGLQNECVSLFQAIQILQNCTEPQGDENDTGKSTPA